MPSILQESSSFQSSKSSSSSQEVQALLPPTSTIGKSDSVQDMLQEMSELNKKMLEKYFKGDRETMAQHYRKALDDTLNDDTTSLLSRRSQLLKKEDSLEDYQEYEDRVEAKVDLHEYQPNEVVIRTADNEVSISAKHEEEKDGKIQISRQFSRNLLLPSNVIFDKIACTLNASGILNIVAPRNVSESKGPNESCEKALKSSTKSESKEVDEAGRQIISKSESHKEEKVVKTQGSSEEMMSKSQKSFVRQEKVSGQEGKFSTQQQKDVSNHQESINDQVLLNNKEKDKVENETSLKKEDKSFFDDFFGRTENRRMDSTSSRIDEHLSRFGKRDMFETRDPVKDMISRMKERHERLLNRRFKGDSDEMFNEYHDFLNKHFSDDPFLPYYTRSMSKIEHQQPVVTENEKDIEIQLGVSQFKPNEISVKTKDRCLEIEAKHEEENKAISTHFRRKYTLPSGVLPDQISSKLSPEGLLIVRIPKMQRLTGVERVIPIKTIQA